MQIVQFKVKYLRVSLLAQKARVLQYIKILRREYSQIKEYLKNYRLLKVDKLHIKLQLMGRVAKA